MIVFDKVPMRDISTSIVSPGVSQTGGSRKAPTPPGVPVMITSPGCNAVNDEQYSTSFSILKIRSLVFADCITVPFRRVTSERLDGSPISSAVTSQGPNAPVDGKFLPGVNWIV